MQVKSHKNATIFEYLLARIALKISSKKNWVPIRTICDKFDFIHRQSLDFAAEREKYFYQRKMERLYEAVDRQVHSVNRESRFER